MTTPNQEITIAEFAAAYSQRAQEMGVPLEALLRANAQVLGLPADAVEIASLARYIESLAA